MAASAWSSTRGKPVTDPVSPLMPGLPMAVSGPTLTPTA